MSIRSIVRQYKQNSEDPHHRYLSQEICRNYFFKNRKTLLQRKELSCLHLAFYLASWGMLRASADLLQKNVHFYEWIIKYIFNCRLEVWGIDVNQYDDRRIALLSKIYDDLAENLKEKNVSPTDTLVTKIMFGVFESVPALDVNVKFALRRDGCNGLQSKGFEDKLAGVRCFYHSHRKLVDRLHVQYRCTRVKIIDMYGFQYGMLWRRWLQI